MKFILKILKKVLLGLGIVIGVIFLISVIFLYTSPQFGGKASDEKKQSYTKSDNYTDGKFKNAGNISTEMSFKDMMKATAGMFKKIPNARPNHSLQVQKIDSVSIENYKGGARIIWFGHSTFLVQINEKNILIDPMLSDVPAPHPWLGSKRFNEEPPITIEQLPKIDVVLLSHDHYDHLDYESIIKLKDKVEVFYTPLGLGNHLLAWGIDDEKITELDWWENTQFYGLTFTSTPAQHFSGRGLSDRDQTLWCSWIIKSSTEQLFFSGDSGYGAHFKEIGEKYGPFDFAMIECGQYNELWSEIHMFPEETAQAAIDLNTKSMMPIHWGAFKLAQHSWTDPIERVEKKAAELSIPMVIPQIGEPVFISKPVAASNDWWK